MELTWIDVDPHTYAQLRTAADLRQHKACTYEQYLAERASGWPGSDGSSNSPDTIWGLRVGLTTIDLPLQDGYRPDLATWNHDERYRCERRLRACGLISEAEAEALREQIDLDLLLELFQQIQAGSWWLRALRRRRALKYYEGVRLGGAGSIRPRSGEAYPRLAASAA